MFSKRLNLIQPTFYRGSHDSVIPKQKGTQMIPNTAVTTNQVNSYYELKNGILAHGRLSPETFPGRIVTALSRTVTTLTDSIIPTVYEYTPEKVSNLVKRSFNNTGWAFAGACMYDMDWMFNACLIYGAAHIEREYSPQAKPAVRDATIALFALHTLKAGWNAWSFLKKPSLPSLIGCLFDVTACVNLARINNSQIQQAAAENKDKDE